MVSSTELLDLDDGKSLVRTRFEGIVYLRDIDAINFGVTSGFEDYSFMPENRQSLREKLDSFSLPLERKGYDLKLIGGLHEAVKNAYEHGHFLDNSKKITLLSSIDHEKAAFVVGDEGGAIDARLFPYILKLRQGRDYGQGFYQFVGIPSSEGHSGLGTAVMHLLFDNVNYYRGQNNGLWVSLEKIR